MAASRSCSRDRPGRRHADLLIDWIRDVPRFSVSVMGVVMGTVALSLAFVKQGGIDFTRYQPIVVVKGVREGRGTRSRGQREIDLAKDLTETDGPGGGQYATNPIESSPTSADRQDNPTWPFSYHPCGSGREGTMDRDANLLFGVLALQLDLLDCRRFADACCGWAAQKDQSLGDLLIDRGWISLDDRAEIERLLRASCAGMEATPAPVSTISGADSSARHWPRSRTPASITRSAPSSAPPRGSCRSVRDLARSARSLQPRPHSRAGRIRSDLAGAGPQPGARRGA